MLKKLTQAGDTIVEVLLAIAVISLVLVGAYIATNKNTASTQDAQERTQAVKLVEQQIEFLHARNGQLNQPGDCFSGATEVSNTGAQGSNPCIVASDGTMATSTTVPAYTLSINPGSSAGTFEVKTVWDSAVGIRSNVTMYYEP